MYKLCFRPVMTALAVLAVTCICPQSISSPLLTTIVVPKASKGTSRVMMKKDNPIMNRPEQSVVETTAGWKKSTENPVMGGKYGTCFDISVLKEGPTYRMWLSWRPKQSIALVESKDGIHWSEPPMAVLGPRPDTGWEDDINRPIVIKRGNVYHMWYTGQAKGHSSIGYATSADGVSWKRMSNNPVLSPETPWEKVAVMCPNVMWDEKLNLYKMWYSGGEQNEPNAIGYATSPDGLIWTKLATNPIFTPDPALDWEKHKVTACQVEKRNGWYMMFYIGFQDEEHAQIGIARSKDGVSNWQRHPANPIVRPGNEKWDHDACYKPYAIYDGKKWLLWYNGRHGELEQIGVVTHEGEDLGFPNTSSVLKPETFKHYVDGFIKSDNELYTGAIPNKEAWDFLSTNIPLFECPDKEMESTYYFRWWTYRKHIKQTPDGFIVDEFLPNVSWAGKDNAISCAAGHHFREGRWLTDPRYINDYGIFWLRKGGALRSYSFWIADSVWQRYCVTGDRATTLDFLPDLIQNYEAWEKDHCDANGLYWQIDDRDGMEVSIGGSGYRATINSYQYGDAQAIANIAEMAGKPETAKEYRNKAAKIKQLVEEKLWDKDAQFFKVLPRGEGARLADVREEHGYTPWYFNMPDTDKAVAWKQIMDPKGFYAPYGPTTAEQRHPKFEISYKDHECQWNGPSWPFATSITLTGMANLLNGADQTFVSNKDYFELLKIYTGSHHRKLDDGSIVPWIDENLNPLTGDWISRTRLKTSWDPGAGGIERGKDYNHSTYCDLIISGLIGLRPRADNVVEVNPLVPEGKWDYFCLDRVRYHGSLLTILYDRTGARYKKGKGLHVFADGKEIAASSKLGRVSGMLPNTSSKQYDSFTTSVTVQYLLADKPEMELVSTSPAIVKNSASLVPGVKPIPAFTSGARILFQGDSITDGNRGRSADPNHILGHGYVFITAAKYGAAFPEMNLDFTNRGVSGNTVLDLEKRWKEDTLDLKPDLLSILIGVNDNGRRIPFEQFEQVYDKLLADARSANPKLKLVLCEPFGNPGVNLDSGIRKRQEIVVKLAKKYDAALVKFQHVFDEAAKRAPINYWIWDGVHPTYRGHQLMADEWERAVRGYWK